MKKKIFKPERFWDYSIFSSKANNIFLHTGFGLDLPFDIYKKIKNLSKDENLTDYPNFIDEFFNTNNKTNLPNFRPLEINIYHSNGKQLHAINTLEYSSYLENIFKALISDDEKLESNVTIIIGDSGSGKSTMLLSIADKIRKENLTKSSNDSIFKNFLPCYLDISHITTINEDKIVDLICNSTGAIIPTVFESINNKK